MKSMRIHDDLDLIKINVCRLQAVQ